MRKELTKEKQVLDLARKAKILRLQDLAEKGIHPEHLRRLYQRGLLVRMGRGVLHASERENLRQLFSRGGGKEGTARHYMSTVGAPFPRYWHAKPFRSLDCARPKICPSAG